MIERTTMFESAGLNLAGVLRYPEIQDARIPAVLMVHGSLEQDRDGNLLQKRDGKLAFKKNFFLEISKRLCLPGFATFSWDRRGFGDSEKPQRPGSYLDDVKDALAALQALSLQTDIIDPMRIAVLGQSAGVYTACLMAKEDSRPKAYVLQGGLFSDYEKMMAFNYRRAVEYASRSKECLKWVEETDPIGLVIGHNLKEMAKRARRGETEQVISYNGRTVKLHHDPTCYQEEYAPARQFRYIQKPTLVIHGACDLNVPTEDAFQIEKELRARGNLSSRVVIIPNADHSFQVVPDDEELRLRERMSLESFRRPYSELYFQVLTDFLERVL
ncbi:MAG: alpha/beta hydrolase [Methanothrix sp.]|nr:alpha/beta hydrolase [Methanothrix sp.]